MSTPAQTSRLLCSVCFRVLRIGRNPCFPASILVSPCHMPTCRSFAECGSSATWNRDAFPCPDDPYPIGPLLGTPAAANEGYPVGFAGQQMALDDPAGLSFGFDGGFDFNAPLHLPLPVVPPMQQDGGAVAGDDVAVSAPTFASAPAPSECYKRRKAPGHVKRPANAWILYRSDKVRELAATAGAGAYQPDLSKHIGLLWRGESNAVRWKYERRAKEEKERHAIAHPGYKYKPAPARK